MEATIRSVHPTGLLVPDFDGASSHVSGRKRYGPGSSQRRHNDRAVRRAIQHSQASLSALARRYGINPKTVAKWKRRSSVADLPTGPREPRSSVLSLEDEPVIVAFRRHTLLPLDDCLYALQATVPHLTRPSPDEDWRRDDPTRRIRAFSSRSDGFEAWTEGDISAFDAHHPSGSRAPLAKRLVLSPTCERTMSSGRAASMCEIRRSLARERRIARAWQTKEWKSSCGGNMQS